MNSNQISIEQINKLDVVAFQLLYSNYYKALVGYAIQLTGEQSVSEDIVQDLFSAIWEKKKSFQSLTSLKVYLYNSVRNASLDYLKHKEIESGYIEKLISVHREYRLGEDEEDDFFDEEVYRQLFRTIDSLPDRCKEIFLMHMSGKKNEEIALALHVSLETVKTQKKRAMSYLRKMMDNRSIVLLNILLP